MLINGTPCRRGVWESLNQEAKERIDLRFFWAVQMAQVMYQIPYDFQWKPQRIKIEATVYSNERVTPKAFNLTWHLLHCLQMACIVQDTTEEWVEVDLKVIRDKGNPRVELTLETLEDELCGEEKG